MVKLLINVMEWLAMFCLLGLIGFVAYRVIMERAGRLHPPSPELTIADMRVMLSSVSPENRFVVYRMVLSDRQDPDGFRLNERGELDPEGKLRLDYVGVCDVEAWIPMDRVRLEVKEASMSVTVPTIELYPMVNYAMSFAWREPRHLPNDATPRVMEAIRSRAVDRAVERGILMDAQDAARRWFEAFLRPFGYDVAIEFEG